MNNSIFAEGAGYVRGRFVPIAEAVLPVTDWGFTRSDVVYDVVHEAPILAAAILRDARYARSSG